MPVKRLPVVLAGTLLLAVLTACSGVQTSNGQSVKKISLAYQPIPDGVLPAAKVAQEITLNPFKDEREPGPLGVASNYGGHVFFVVQTDDDVSAWVTQALATELRRAGFKVKTGGGAAEPADCVVNGVVNEITVHGIITNMRITLQAAKGFKVLVNASYNADAEGYKGPWFNTVYTTDYPQLYGVALRNLMVQVVPQLVTALNEPPRP